MTCGGSSEKCVPFAMAAAYVYRDSVVYTGFVVILPMLRHKKCCCVEHEQMRAKQ